MRRLKMIVSYDGSEFHGWQIQPNALTIQAVLQDILSEIEGSPVKLEGSGRTDAGVHAIGQAASFSLINPIPCYNLEKAVNRLLPRSIRVVSIEECPPTFHARFDAKVKHYEYRIYRDAICPPFERHYVFHYPYPHDWELFKAAGQLLVGKHDFSAFAAADDKDVKGFSKVRTIYSVEVHENGPQVSTHFRGSGFLKHMVRNLIGTMIQCGRGSMSLEQVKQLLLSGQRKDCGPTAPASGLFLVSVEY
jgi:tRNA pseudouridine38-40 synthase